ncbi:MAG: cytochrome c3 family protein [Planctomycetota bacterium]
MFSVSIGSVTEMNDNGDQTTNESKGVAGASTAVHAPDRSTLRTWAIWLLINLLVSSYFLYGLFAPASSIKSAWLPGETTHGHYQIELDCDACHSPARDTAEHSSDNVMQDACIRCHQSQLDEAKDTHPAKKFNDPTNADRLLLLNAQDCLACHREHVPEQTLDMGLTIPDDYCWHCHQDVAENRPSHEGMAFNSCATAGCHNYHDNRALNEKFLNAHFDEPDHLASALLPSRRSNRPANDGDKQPLKKIDADAPKEHQRDPSILEDWAVTSHAAAGVNCSGCHVNQEAESWSDTVSMETCGTCHDRQVQSFQTGKHGMRLASGLAPMQPKLARLSMHAGVAHEKLDCNACHSGHRFDTQFAATEACQRCHADSHSMAYEDTAHAELWRLEVSGEGEANTGVSCATCHLPRLGDGEDVWVNHDQNSGLRPNETMALQVCTKCHGLEYSLSALADPALKDSCYGEPPAERNASVQMAYEWFVKQEAKRQSRMRKRKSAD